MTDRPDLIARLESAAAQLAEARKKIIACEYISGKLEYVTQLGYKAFNLDLDTPLTEAAAEIKRLRTELDLEKACREANKCAIVDTVGGLVEGRPTNTLNYLQRLRELVKKESDHA